MRRPRARTSGGQRRRLETRGAQPVDGPRYRVRTGVHGVPEPLVADDREVGRGDRPVRVPDRRAVRPVPADLAGQTTAADAERGVPRHEHGEQTVGEQHPTELGEPAVEVLLHREQERDDERADRIVRGRRRRGQTPYRRRRRVTRGIHQQAPAGCDDHVTGRSRRGSPRPLRRRHGAARSRERCGSRCAPHTRNGCRPTPESAEDAPATPPDRSGGPRRTVPPPR